jgi:hypothetical protein
MMFYAANKNTGSTPAGDLDDTFSMKPFLAMDLATHAHALFSLV